MNAKTDEEACGIVKGKEILESMYEEMKKFVDSGRAKEVFSKAYWDKAFREEALDNARKAGEKKAKKETQIETVKNMLKDGMVPETISKYVNLSIDEIKKLNE